VVTTSCFVSWQESKIDMSELQLKAPQLAEMVSLIEDGTISGKIGKQILPDLLQVCFEAEASALTQELHLHLAHSACKICLTAKVGNAAPKQP